MISYIKPWIMALSKGGIVLSLGDRDNPPQEIYRQECWSDNSLTLSEGLLIERFLEDNWYTLRECVHQCDEMKKKSCLNLNYTGDNEYCYIPAADADDFNKIEACPMPDCNGRLTVIKACDKTYWAQCDNPHCMLCIRGETESNAMAKANELCELARWGKTAKELAENPPQLTLVESLSDNQTKKAHQYYSWAILDCIDRLEAAMEEQK